jgi:antitoxin component YwqK of YwqJK toxin-antitoxin module
VKEAVTYKGGRKEGFLMAYHPNGKLAQKGNYKSDRANGAFVYYDEEGLPSREKVFKMDALVRERDLTPKGAKKQP